MYIKCWGSRGSIPVSGKTYSKYGGDTTCIEIRTADGQIIVVDAGTGIRRLGNHLPAEGRHHYNLLFTHAHWDHLMGFPFFKPIFNEKTTLEMHQCPFHSKFVETVLSKLMAPPYFPVKFAELKAKVTHKEACPGPFAIGSVTIESIALCHPNSGSGYKFTENGKSFVFLTDNELGFDHTGGVSFADYRKFCTAADLLIHDAEYTPEEYETTRGWGHTVYTDALRLALEAGVKKLGLFHLNPERVDRDMDDIVEVCHQKIAASNQRMACIAVDCNMTFEL